MKRLLIATLALFAANSFAYTIYVDSANNGDGDEDGMSWETAWGTINEGRNDLAATNAIEAGGHTVLVTNRGVIYSESVSLGSSHAGTSSVNQNTFRGLGHPVVQGDPCFKFDADSAYITIDGFNAYAQSGPGFYMRDPDITVRNCVIFGYTADEYGVDLSGCHRMKMENCTLYGLMDGIRVYTGYDDCYIKDSIIAACGRGIYERGSFGSVSNCLFYGNALHWNFKFTDDDLNAEDDAGNNKIANPGIRQGQNYYFDRFYENNPAATHASDGGYVGAYQASEITTFGISNVTWYVSPSGDDGRTTDEAANPSTPWQTLSHAQTKATAGTTIIVKPGRYPEEVDFYRGGSHNATSDTDLPLTFQAEVTGCATVYASWAMLDLRKTSGVTIDGFVLDGEGVGRYGVWANNAAGCTFKNITVKNLEVSTGAGFCFVDSGCHTISNAYIADNSCDGIQVGPGGVILLDSQVHNNVRGIDGEYPTYTHVERTRFSGNSYGADNYGGYVYTSGGGYYARYYNCVFDGNNFGVAIRSPNDVYNHYVILYHCVLYGNSTGGFSDDEGKLYLYNTIVAGNTSYGVREDSSSGGCYTRNVYWWNNGVNFYENDTTAWNDAEDIDALSGCYTNYIRDPMFLNAANGNFKVDPHSPVIDKGREFTSITEDYYGNVRPQRDGWDIGCYEAGPLPAAGTIILVR